MATQQASSSLRKHRLAFHVYTRIHRMQIGDINDKTTMMHFDCIMTTGKGKMRHHDTRIIMYVVLCWTHDKMGQKELTDKGTWGK